MDVDDHLTRNDYYNMVVNNLKWPWSLTHFIKVKKCINRCYKPPETTNKYDLPDHFIIDKMNKLLVLMMVSNDKFWCPICATCIYDHYVVNECSFCYEKTV